MALNGSTHQRRRGTLVLPLRLRAVIEWSGGGTIGCAPGVEPPRGSGLAVGAWVSTEATQEEEVVVVSLVRRRRRRRRCWDAAVVQRHRRRNRTPMCERKRGALRWGER
uniref:Uncharacterized protein n=1 Tax=Oryza sativa subsp. japonica TaxID=39947 RepID=Q69UF1_ORYSJ|nr:hypothetical protein [Oryza sativa Japonica Group]BAD33118.1 hypothetical protein [Oryza sativa Japonica Group]